MSFIELSLIYNKGLMGLTTLYEAIWLLIKFYDRIITNLMRKKHAKRHFLMGLWPIWHNKAYSQICGVC